MKHLTHNETQTYQLAGSLLRELDVGGTGATVLCLYGDLGAGKTTFTKALAQHLGSTETIISPTFVIAKYYDLPMGVQWKKMIHVDAYRLDGGHELMKLGFEREFQNPDNLIVIEWPEQVSDCLPADAHKIYFRYIDEHTREISQ